MRRENGIECVIVIPYKAEHRICGNFTTHALTQLFDFFVEKVKLIIIRWNLAKWWLKKWNETTKEVKLKERRKKMRMAEISFYLFYFISFFFRRHLRSYFGNEIEIKDHKLRTKHFFSAQFISIWQVDLLAPPTTTRQPKHSRHGNDNLHRKPTEPNGILRSDTWNFQLRNKFRFEMKINAEKIFTMTQNICLFGSAV